MMSSAPASEALPARHAPVAIQLRIRGREQKTLTEHSAKTRWGLIGLAIALGFLAHFVLREWSSSSEAKISSSPAHGNQDATENAIRFYTERVMRDPEDTRSQNALAALYLERAHDSGNEDYLPLAL